MFALRHLATLAKQWAFYTQLPPFAAIWRGFPGAVVVCAQCKWKHIALDVHVSRQELVSLDSGVAICADAVGWIYADVHKACAGSFCSLSNRFFIHQRASHMCMFGTLRCEHALADQAEAQVLLDGDKHFAGSSRRW
jgi:hypothetical protein